MKTCNKCKINKPLTDFYKDKHNKAYGVTSWCKECANANSKRWYRESEKYRESMRDSGLRRRFGITTDDYYDMFEQQGNVCAICKNPSENYLHVDHDHSTNEIRGLLCNQCNHGLGNFRDSTEYLNNAIKYLDKNIPSNL